MKPRPAERGDPIGEALAQRLALLEVVVEVADGHAARQALNHAALALGERAVALVQQRLGEQADLSVGVVHGDLPSSTSVTG